MTQQLRSIGAISCAKVLAILYGIVGLIIGGIASLFFLFAALAGGFGGLAPEIRGSAFGVVLGLGSIVFFPILYGAMGAIGGLIMAGLYNLAAKYVGGIDVEIG